MAERGKLIVFEGIDGSGKTTQCQMFSARLTEQGIPHIVTREPSGSPIGLLLRDALKKNFTLENEAIALLFAADRVQHVADEILPALKRGEYVLCDRYYYSNLAYQGIENAALYNKKVISDCKPDITFFIDVPPSECLRRIKQNRSGIELYESLEELEREREGYMRVFAHLKERVEIIDGLTGGPEEVARNVFTMFLTHDKL